MLTKNSSSWQQVIFYLEGRTRTKSSDDLYLTFHGSVLSSGSRRSLFTCDAFLQWDSRDTRQPWHSSQTPLYFPSSHSANFSILWPNTYLTLLQLPQKYLPFQGRKISHSHYAQLQLLFTYITRIKFLLRKVINLLLDISIEIYVYNRCILTQFFNFTSPRI